MLQLQSFRDHLSVQHDDILIKGTSRSEVGLLITCGLRRGFSELSCPLGLIELLIVGGSLLPDYLQIFLGSISYKLIIEVHVDGPFSVKKLMISFK